MVAGIRLLPFSETRTSVDDGKPSCRRTIDRRYKIPRIRVAQVPQVDSTQPGHGGIRIGSLDDGIVGSSSFGAGLRASASPASASAPTASAPEREKVGDGRR